jgi:hypothetical protein
MELSPTLLPTCQAYFLVLFLPYFIQAFNASFLHVKQRKENGEKLKKG